MCAFLSRTWGTGETIMNKEHKEYLDELRESGATNMFGAAQYLMEEFDMDKKEARQVLTEWMTSFK